MQIAIPTPNEAALHELARLARYTLSVTTPLLERLRESLPVSGHLHRQAECLEMSAAQTRRPEL